MVLAAIYFSLALVLIIVSILPLISNQYWIFRICEFARIQILAFQVFTLILGFIVYNQNPNIVLISEVSLFAFAMLNIVLLAPYLPYKELFGNTKTPTSTNSITLLSFNVYQYNKEYQNFISLINDVKPDIFLTMESNADWETALSVLDSQYPYRKKIALENTYGMHFYSKLKVDNCKVNYFMADDLPSIEAMLTTKNNEKLTFFGTHPPPPSPTEEDTSKERDGEIIMIGKKVKKYTNPLIVVGDFNNVAWSKSSRLFKKISGLTDARIGRGFFSTYHANYKLLRFPIDLLFHSNSISIEEFKTLKNIGSDHLPLYCRFSINSISKEKETNEENLSKDDVEEMNEMIQEGKEEKGNRD
ncbi:endonuclease/exonuclease/phosphatase family protein [Flavobacteriaceae bacterium XHP0103]|uniref:endonuclease/exonuclease/phosphatase family protein n=1 Tax=Marixanthotalea marina TaxID=2844359 RepID=UPI002989BF77|nr:endonuclease/exonuclease/phosphatase family protein [Marixanthotalea marina]MBU3822694.1 endonuclease/exonuclease/phosphatase family protein [Marixanthotalea marina]